MCIVKQINLFKQFYCNHNMGNEEEIWGDRGSIIYKDDRIIISKAESIDEHDLTVDHKATDGIYCFLPRNILKDLANRHDIKSFEASMNAMNSNFVYQFKQKNMPLENLAWAFAKARMYELEDEVHYFIDKAREKTANDI